MTQMRNVDHTHPHTDEPFGEPFRRGTEIVADGGTSEGADETADETMKDVDHEASTADTTRAFERGTEGRDETV